MDGDGTGWGVNCKLNCYDFGYHNCSRAHCSTKNCTDHRCADCDGDGYNADFGEPNCSINDARNAAKIFVSLLNATNDQSGIVTFNKSAYHHQNLTSDKATVLASIDIIRTRDDTGIGYGIGNATDELKTRSRTGAKKVEILLTDGHDDLGIPCCNGATNSCCTDAEGAAQEAANENITIYSIGVGATSYLNSTLLGNVASITGGKYYYVPNSGELSGIYEEIAYEIKTDIIRFGLISNQPYNVSKEKVYGLSQDCSNLDVFNLGTYRLKIYNSTNLMLLCGTDTLTPPKIFVSKYVLIENDTGNVTLELW
jgi:hypothetical protein